MNKPRPPTCKMIDDACRLGFYVYTGSREKGTERQVVGAELHRNGEVTRKGYVWIHMDDDHSWHYVENNAVTITNEPFERKEPKMPTGKRAAGRPSHLTAVKKKAESATEKTEKEAKKLLASGKVEEVNEERSGQLRIPGAPKKVHSAIEAQALLVHELQMKRIKAAKKEGEARDVLTKMMVDAKIEEQDLPDDLVAEIDREPKALVHKKRKKSKTKKERAVEEDTSDE